jgi:hypothetical protein
MDCFCGPSDFRLRILISRYTWVSEHQGKIHPMQQSAHVGWPPNCVIAWKRFLDGKPCGTPSQIDAQKRSCDAAAIPDSSKCTSFRSHRDAPSWRT